MDSSSELSSYEIKSVVEQEPYLKLSPKEFLKKWCEVNDSINPVFLDRYRWEKKESILDEGTIEGKHSLYIPEDMHLWEMVAVMEAVDQNTFKDNPERRDQAKREIEELGKTLKNAGVYIAQRMDAISQGKEIARAMAEEFYGYGKALVERKKEETPGIEKIATEILTEEETKAMDKFLAGEKLYESRMQRVRDGDIEAERRRTLGQFFAASERAFELRKRRFDSEAPENREGLKPWQEKTPFYNAFIKKIEGSIKREIEKPKRGITDSIFSRGMALLEKNMPFDKLPTQVKERYLHWQEGETVLKEALHIDRMKADLENTRRFGTIEQISAKERDIVDLIQNVVSKYPRDGVNNPTEIIARQTINCAGASILSGALMQEAGINYLVGSVPSHSILFLVTSDGKLEWRDMLNSRKNEILTDEMIQGNNKDGTPITVADIVAFSRESPSEGLTFDIKGDGYRDKLRWVDEGQRQYVTVFGPEFGQKIQILNNLGNYFIDSGRKDQALETFQQLIAYCPKDCYPYYGLGSTLLGIGRDMEAVEAYRKAIEIDPKYVITYVGLGTALERIGRKEEAIMAYQKAIEINPKYVTAYTGLGTALERIGRKEEAIMAYQKAIEINPTRVMTYLGFGSLLGSIGRKEEAIEAYRKFIELADKEKRYELWIKGIEKIIAKLQRELVRDTIER